MKFKFGWKKWRKGNCQITEIQFLAVFKKLIQSKNFKSFIHDIVILHTNGKANLTSNSVVIFASDLVEATIIEIINKPCIETWWKYCFHKIFASRFQIWPMTISILLARWPVHPFSFVELLQYCTKRVLNPRALIYCKL